ncbi:hypothetical protein ACQCSU_08180 [Pseudarthrobacter sp. O4]|uniref:hypothetical protein n=1 Tax=Pseudarthrobacter sp. O4 TaxID=3418417 RepID=UPI003CF5E383
MTSALIGVLALAVWLALAPPGGPGRRFRRQLAGPPRQTAPEPADSRAHRGQARRGLRRAGRNPRGAASVPMTVLVQQLAALLRGGRTPSRLWDELWHLYGGDALPGRSMSDGPPRDAALAPDSLASLAAARAAARCGAPVGEAIRSAATGRRARAGPGFGKDDAGRERANWIELAACFDVAEVSGCPLADILTRFAAQLEAEEDAEAARQTALAGPRATVRLLSWLPVLGLGLGMLLGVDPIDILLGAPLGLAALAAGVALTAAGRIWSARLVRSAAGETR